VSTRTITVVTRTKCILALVCLEMVYVAGRPPELIIIACRTTHPQASCPTARWCLRSKCSRSNVVLEDNFALLRDAIVGCTYINLTCWRHCVCAHTTEMRAHMLVIVRAWHM
jgi:hypothetical protein